MQNEYYILVSENEESEEDTYIVCVYLEGGDGSPIIDHYDELDVSLAGLELLLNDDLAELPGSPTVYDCEIIREY
jgi:hypothetical protein